MILCEFYIDFQSHYVWSIIDIKIITQKYYNKKPSKSISIVNFGGLWRKVIDKDMHCNITILYHLYNSFKSLFGN